MTANAAVPAEVRSPHLERGRAEHHDGGQRQGELGDGGALLADGLAAQQEKEF